MFNRVEIWWLWQYDLYHCHPVDGGGVILDKTTPVRIETFHHRINMISSKNIWFAVTISLYIEGDIIVQLQCRDALIQKHSWWKAGLGRCGEMPYQSPHLTRTQLKICVRFWSDMLVSALHYHHRNTTWRISFWKNDVYHSSRVL